MRPPHLNGEYLREMRSSRLSTQQQSRCRIVYWIHAHAHAALFTTPSLPWADLLPVDVYCTPNDLTAWWASLPIGPRPRRLPHPRPTLHSAQCISSAVLPWMDGMRFRFSGSSTFLTVRCVYIWNRTTRVRTNTSVMLTSDNAYSFIKNIRSIILIFDQQKKFIGLLPRPKII